MKIEDFDGMHEARDAAELEVVLMKRFGPGVNEFWLSHNDRFPAMSIWVRNDLATLHFFEKERDPGYRSIGTLAEEDGTTIFHTESVKHKESVPNRFVVPYALALAAAKEFFSSKQLPASIEWMRL
jgi:hypothetical protein